jgi:uncharacterized membrane protein
MVTITALIICLCGILVSGYMYLKKKHHQSLSCPRDNPCDVVLHSRFGTTLGISNELLGVGYFTLVSLFLLLRTTLPLFHEGVVSYGLFLVLCSGALFSLYLIGLQAFIIRSWCAWCLSIAAINAALIVASMHLSFTAMFPLLASQKLWWVIVHNIGFILGVGSATITDIFFFRSLRDNTISQEEKETMDTFSTIIWAGLGILIVSGIAIYLPDQIRLAISAKFLLKLVVVGVIIVNGIFLNMIVAPRMRRLTFGGEVPARRFRRLAFALGGISFTSWYIAFFLGSLRKIHVAFIPAIIGYGGVLVCVVVVSQIMERYITKKHQTVKVSEL